LTKNGIYHTFQLGDVFGLSDLLLTDKNTTTIISADLTEILNIPPAKFLTIMEK